MSRNPILSVSETTDVVNSINSRKFETPVESIFIRPTMGADQIELTMEAEGRRFGLEKLPEKAVLRMLGLSRKFIDSCKDDLALCENALRKAHRGLSKEDDKLLQITTAGNDKIVSVLPVSEHGHLMSLAEAWQEVKNFPGVIGSAEVVDLTRGRFDIRVVTEFFNQPPTKIGDITHSGVRISIGPRVTVNPFSYRLVCTNGMQRNQEGDVFEVDLADPLVSLRRGFQASLDISQRMTEDFVRTDSIIVPNPHEYVLRALRIAGASDKVRTGVADLVRNQAPNNTLYELLNIVTSVARDQESKSKRNKIENIAGCVLSMQAGAARCTKCDSQV